MELADLLVPYKNVGTLKEQTHEDPIVDSKNRYLRFLDYIAYLSSKPLEETPTEETPVEETPVPAEPEFTFVAPDNEKSTFTQSTSATPKSYHPGLEYMTDPAQYSYTYFSQKGLNNIQISGILGNLIGESGLNTKATNNFEKTFTPYYGRGIAQWSNERIDLFEQVMHKKITDASLKDLLDFVWYEMSRRPALLKALSEAGTVKEATDAVYRGFENGGANRLASIQNMNDVYKPSWAKFGKEYNFETELNKRTEIANRFYNTDRR